MKFDGYGASNDVLEVGATTDVAYILDDKLLVDNFIPESFSATTSYNITDLSTITINKKDQYSLATMDPITIKSEESRLVVTQTSIEDGLEDVSTGGTNGKKDCYIFTIKDTSGFGSIATNRGNIILDLRQIIRNFKPNMTFRFINQTGYPVAVKILRNADTNAGETLASVDEHIDNQFWFIADKSSTGEIIFNRIDDMHLEDDYVIAVIVRDKKPNLGQTGRIIKKMVDVYSYAPTE
jgi:hypothetical protein